MFASRARLHVVAAAVVNVVGFGLFVSFAQLAAATSRVVIVNYSMSVWASLFGRPSGFSPPCIDVILPESPDPMRSTRA